MHPHSAAVLRAGATAVGSERRPRPPPRGLSALRFCPRTLLETPKKGDDWSISGVYCKDGKEVGGFTGKDVKYHDNGELSYISHVDKAPPGKGGANEARITLTLKDGNIIEHWRVGRSRGSHTWTPAK